MTTTGWIRKRPWWPGCALCWRWAGTRRLCTRHARLATLLDPILAKLATDGAAIASDIMLYGEAWYHPASRTVVDPRSVADSRHYDPELIGDRWQGPELKRFWHAWPNPEPSPAQHAADAELHQGMLSILSRPVPLHPGSRQHPTDQNAQPELLDRAFPENDSP